MRIPSTLLLTLALAPAALADDTPAKETPAKEIPVHAVPFSHEDVGYADNLFVLRTENRLENLFRALAFCDETADWPDAAKYRYQQEVAEPIPFFLSACTPEERLRFAEYMHEGRIRVAATHTTVLADRLTPEAGARLFYLGNRHLPDMLGVPAGKVAMVNDVTGLPWSLPILCEEARVPWLFHGHNSGGRCDEFEAAPQVRWTGAGGTGSVLVHSDTYNRHHADSVPKLLFAEAGKKAAPDQAPLFLYGWDFAVADRKLSDAAKDWNARGTGRPIRVSTFEDWFPAQEKLKTPPVVAGKTGPCQWMDQPISDAVPFGRARMAAERLPAAEKWNAVALALAPEAGRAWPWFDFTAGWHALLSNFEHTIGAACWRCKNLEGFVHYETELVEHRAEAETAVATSVRALDSALAAIAAQIASPHEHALAVFNPSGRARTGPVTLAMPAKGAMPGGTPPASYAAVDDATGEQTPCQWLDRSTLAFLAKEVPALGYRSYHLVPAPAAAPADGASAASRTGASPAGPHSASGSREAESPFYRLALDPESGCVASLFDKELGRELVNKDAPQAFNQYLRLHIANPRKREFLASPRQSGAKITVERGPVCDIVHVEATAENTRSFGQVITLWHGVKRVDFALRLDKEPSGRDLVDYFANNLDGKEACFASMPFDIPGFKAVYETGGGGVAEPVKDQFKGTGTAHHAVQRFADLSNADFGVTVSPVDCALVQFGPARADAISRVMNDGGETRFEKNAAYPTQSTLQLYLMSNMFSTNIRVDQPGRHAFHWSLRSHKGGWEAGGAPEFGEDVNQPMAVRMLPAAARKGLPAGAHSFAKVDAPNVALSTVKAAEWNGDGYIVRLAETTGRATAAKLEVPFLGTLAQAEEVSLTEDALGAKPLAVEKGAVAVTLPPYGVKTLRLVPAAAKPAQVAGLSAKPLSDMQVELAWEPVKGAAFYRIYRGDAADFAPTPLHLVALTAGTGFVDQAQNHGASWPADRLNAGTAYFYKVEAVSRQNLRGPLSAAAGATTPKEATCAPAQVAELHAVAVSPLAPANQVALLWRSNVEPNIAAYEIHRSRQAGFTPSDRTLLAKVPVRASSKATRFRWFDHQMFVDKAVAPATTYHYAVRAVTREGLAGAFSAPAEVTTKTDDDGKPAQPSGDSPEATGNDDVR